MILKIILNLDEKWCSMVSILFNGTSEKYYNGTKVFFGFVYMGHGCILYMKMIIYIFLSTNINFIYKKLYGPF